METPRSQGNQENKMGRKKKTGSLQTEWITTRISKRIEMFTLKLPFRIWQGLQITTKK